MSGSGNITVWINSPGGDCVAAAQIYNMLMDYHGDVTVKIDGIAASAASVIAMAGTKVLMSPTALMMIHNPLTVAIGDSEEMQKAIDKYYWLYRVKFGIPATNLATKGDSITFSTPTIEGTILRRNKADAGGKHPWKAEALEGDTPAATITGWYKEVYEPAYTAAPEKTT